MGEVYLARKRGIGGFERTVVLKIMLPHLAVDDRFARMFVDEARIASALAHPNIVQVYDLGASEEGALYLAMEHLQGVSAIACLKRCARDGIWVPQDLAARVIADAATGLAYAHAATGEDGEPLGLVHRDISPENLFLTYAGPTKVLDFGVAKVRDRLAETQAGEFKGKVGYMAPEIIRGEEPDARADLFSLGVVFFELLTNRRLFHAPVPATALHRVLSAPVPDVRSLREDADDAVSEIVAHLLERHPKRRLGSADEVVDRLESWLTGRAGSHMHVSRWLQERFADAHDLSARIARAVEATGKIDPNHLKEARRLNGEQLADTVFRELSDSERRPRSDETPAVTPAVTPAEIPAETAAGTATAAVGPAGTNGAPVVAVEADAPASETLDADAGDDSWIRDEARSRGFWGVVLMVGIIALVWLGADRLSQPSRPRVWDDKYVEKSVVYRQGIGAVIRAEGQANAEPFVIVAESTTANTGQALGMLEDGRRRLERLDDPGLPAPVQVGVSRDRPFSVYALEPGGSLANVLEDQDISAGRGLRLVRALARTMARAEAARLVHGWLSPHLVWVTAKDRVCVLGFRGPRPIGQANYKQDSKRLAPEVGPSVPPGQLADQYALAVMLEDILRRVDQRSYEAAAKVLARASAVEPNARFESTELFVQALERALRRRYRHR